MNGLAELGAFFDGVEGVGQGAVAGSEFIEADPVAVVFVLCVESGKVFAEVSLSVQSATESRDRRMREMQTRCILNNYGTYMFKTCGIGNLARDHPSNWSISRSWKDRQLARGREIVIGKKANTRRDKNAVLVSHKKAQERSIGDEFAVVSASNGVCVNLTAGDAVVLLTVGIHAFAVADEGEFWQVKVDLLARWMMRDKKRWRRVRTDRLQDKVKESLSRWRYHINAMILTWR